MRTGMESIKNIVILLLVVALVAVFTGRRGNGGDGVFADTISVTIYDTITCDKPVPRDSVVVSYVVEKLVIDNGECTIDNDSDSALVSVPITSKVYEDSLYRAVVSGYRASLDEITVYPRMDIVTITEKPKRKRWGVGVQVGYGMTLNGRPQLSPYAGIGVSYNLFNF